MHVGEISVLVVDDVNAMRVQVKELLKQAGFQKVALASNGEEAKKMLVDQPVNLILCDWHMSPTDGLALLSFVRSNEKMREIPFIMVTAESTKEQVMEAVKAGVDDYAVKPLTIGQIQGKVFAALTKRKVLG